VDILRGCGDILRVLLVGVEVFKIDRSSVLCIQRGVWEFGS